MNSEDRDENVKTLNPNKPAAGFRTEASPVSTMLLALEDLGVSPRCGLIIVSIEPI